MIKIVEWSQNKHKQAEITVKACLRGGVEANFQLDMGAIRHLPRFCVLHINLENRTEEILLCDFKNLKKIAAAPAMVPVTAPAPLSLRDCSLGVIELEGSYSIRHSETVDRPWLGPDGWQVSRYEFRFPAVCRKEKTPPDESRTEKSLRSSKTIHLAAAAVFLAVVSIAVPLVSGHLSSQTPAKILNSDRDLKSAVNQTASLDSKGVANGLSTSDISARNIQEDGPARKVKEALKSASSRPKEKNHKIAAEKRGASLDIPCTRDMAEKGISCN